MTMNTLGSVAMAGVFVGIFLFGLRTGRMPGGLSYFSRAENDWGFWMFGVLYLAMACVALYVGFFGSP